MSITWTEDADSRQNLGDSGILQQNTATFGFSDYPAGRLSGLRRSFRFVAHSLADSVRIHWHCSWAWCFSTRSQPWQDQRQRIPASCGSTMAGRKYRHRTTSTARRSICLLLGSRYATS